MDESARARRTPMPNPEQPSPEQPSPEHASPEHAGRQQPSRQQPSRQALAAEATAVEATIERLVPGGAGFGHLPDGRALFVAGAFPGEHVRVDALDLRSRHAHATRWTLLAASPERRPSPCPVSSRCGGCDWIELDEGAQRAHKLDLLEQALRRTGRLHDLPPLPPVEHAGPSLGYRGRVRLHVSEAGHLGFCRTGSHEVVPIESCAVCRPELNHALARLRAATSAQPGLLAPCATVELRVAPGDGSVVVHLHGRRHAPPLGATVASLRALVGDPLRVSGDALPEDASAPAQRFSLGGQVELELGPTTFTQIHPEVNECVRRAVVAGARARGARTFCDLYCGAGNFALALLAAGLEGVGVEAHAAAVRAARAAQREAGLAGGSFLVGQAARVARRLAGQGRTFDLLVLDPPRSGAREALDAVLALGPRWLAYVSCDPVTLARDLGRLVHGGYRVEAVQGFDMFPQTHHLETLVWMHAPTTERSPS